MYPKPLIPPKKRRRLRRKPAIISALVVLIALAYVGVAITRPFAELSPNRASSALTITTPASNLPWPSYGQGAFGLSSGKVIATNGEQTPVPIASAAKVITALIILDKHPLAAGASGPKINITEADVALYKRYVALGGSVVPVSAGQKLTERQMLQAMLLPSANNVADSLANWSFGSVKDYLAYANTYLAQKGLSQTRVGGDASGYSPSSTSTASDLVKLGALAMQNPALAEIVGQKLVTIPGVGMVSNYNSLIGTNGIVGIKTGNNDQNAGVFIGAANTTVNGKTVTVITALSGAPSLSRVLRDSGTLLAASRSTFADTTVVTKDAVLGTYKQADGTSLQAVAAKDISTTVLRGDTVKATVKLNSISYGAKAGQVVGTVTVPATDLSPAHSVSIVLRQTPTKPDLGYRLTHP